MVHSLGCKSHKAAPFRPARQERSGRICGRCKPPQRTIPERPSQNGQIQIQANGEVVGVAAWFGARRACAAMMLTAKMTIMAVTMIHASAIGKLEHRFAFARLRGRRNPKDLTRHPGAAFERPVFQIGRRSPKIVEACRVGKIARDGDKVSRPCLAILPTRQDGEIVPRGHCARAAQIFHKPSGRNAHPTALITTRPLVPADAGTQALTQFEAEQIRVRKLQPPFPGKWEFCSFPEEAGSPLSRGRTGGVGSRQATNQLASGPCRRSSSRA